MLHNDKQMIIMVNTDLANDFDKAANLLGRSRAVHIRELMIAEVKRAVRKNPDAFKGE